MNLLHLEAQLKQDEGLSLTCYKDSLGNWTIGYGHLLSRECAPITAQFADLLLQADIEALCKQLLKVEWWLQLDQVRQEVIANMAFNMGLNGLLLFKHMIAAIRIKDYRTAAEEMGKSLWAKQVGKRAARLRDEMKSGILTT